MFKAQSLCNPEGGILITAKENTNAFAEKEILYTPCAQFKVSQKHFFLSFQ